jgi:DNA-binding transcriptional MerR regulator
MAEEKLFGVPVEETPLFGEPVEKDSSNVAEFLPEFLQGRFEGTAVQEIGEGVVSGGVGIIEGLAGAAATGYDLYTGDTDYAETVTQAAEAVRDYAGLDPEGFLGKGAEIVTQFVAPGVGVASKVAKLSKLARAKKGIKGPLTKKERLVNAAKEIGAVAGTEALLVPEGTQTVLGDYVGISPLETNDLIGLEGREKALARIGNRVKTAIDAAALGAAAQGLISGTGKTVGALANTTQGQVAGKKISQISKETAQKAKRGLDAAATRADNLLYQKMTDPDGMSYSRKLLADTIAFGRYRGYLPDQVALDRLLLDSKVQSKIGDAEKVLKRLDNGIKEALESNSAGTNSPLDEIDMLNSIDDYLVQSDDQIQSRLLKDLGKYGPGVQSAARDMRMHVDDLSNNVLNSEFLKRNKFTTPDGQSVEDIIRRNIGSYMRRQYKIFTDEKYVPDASSIKNADEFFKSNKDVLEKELTDFARKDIDGIMSDEFLRRNKLSRKGTGDSQEIIFYGDNVSDETAQFARKHFLNAHKLKNRQIKGGRVARDKMNTGIFLERSEIPATLRALLGEVKDPREAYMSTIADLAQFSATDKYFANVVDLAKESETLSKLFRSGRSLTPLQRKSLTDQGYVQLGGEDGASSIVNTLSKEGDATQQIIGRSGWGALDDYYVPQDIYKDLTRQVIGDDNVGMQMARNTFSTFLRLKALSQYGKTILSPVTQVRNFTTATAFALANGNVPVLGRGSNLRDARRIVFANISGQGDDAVLNKLGRAQELGILGTNAELREIQDSLRKGVGGYDDNARDGMTAMMGKKIGNKIKKVTKPSEDIYQGSDDFWKFFNWEAEQAKLKHALKDSDMDTQLKYLAGTGDISPNMMNKIRRGQINSNALNELYEERAAQIVRDTVPNYDKAASQLVTFARKLPVGNFIVFPMEIYRTGFNIMRQSIDDMASEIPGVQARGRQRMLSSLGTWTALPATIAGLGYTLSGVSKEDMETYQKYFGAPWEKGAILVPLSDKSEEDGKIKYFNLSTSNPYDTLGRSFRRVLREIDTAQEQGKTTGQVLTDVMLGSVAEFFEPFLSEGMLTESLLNVSIRGGRTGTGAEVYDPEDNVGDKGGKIIAHVMNTMLPNVSPVKLKNVNPFSPLEFAEPKKILRGTIGQVAPGIVNPKTKIGREVTGMDVLNSVFGVSPQEFDMKKGLAYAAFGMSRAQGNARSQFNTLTDDANVTSGDLLRGFTKANEAKLRVDREYYQIIKGMRQMGLKNSEIRRILKNENIGGVKSILRGKFEPFKITPNNKKELRANDLQNILPIAEINAIRNSLRNISLDPEEPDSDPREIQNKPDTRVEETPLFGEPSQSSIPTPAPINANLASMSVQPGAIDPNLLGNNPANIQLAQRLGRV